MGSLSPSFTGCQPAPEAECSYLSDEVLWSARDKPPEKGAAGSSREEPNPQQLGDGTHQRTGSERDPSTSPVLMAAAAEFSSSPPPQACILTSLSDLAQMPLLQTVLVSPLWESHLFQTSKNASFAPLLWHFSPTGCHLAHGRVAPISPTGLAGSRGQASRPCRLCPPRTLAAPRRPRWTCAG